MATDSGELKLFNVKRGPKMTPEERQRMRDFISLFQKHYKENRGGGCIIKEADKGCIAVLIKHFNEEDIKLIIETYFDHRGQLKLGRGYTPSNLWQCIEDLKEIMKDGGWEEK